MSEALTSGDLRSSLALGSRREMSVAELDDESAEIDRAVRIEAYWRDRGKRCVCRVERVSFRNASPLHCVRSNMVNGMPV